MTASLTRTSPVAISPKNGYETALDSSLTLVERALFDHPALDNFSHFADFSDVATGMFFAKVYDQGELAAVAPVVKLRKRRTTDMLAPSIRRWLGPTIGILSRRTTYLVDTAFMAYQYASPFSCIPEADQKAVKRAIFELLRQQPDVDSIWIAEPESEAAWLAEAGMDAFHILPMVHVVAGGYTSLDQFIAGLSKKRRRNYRDEQRAFCQSGATIRTLEAPLTPGLAAAAHKCLQESARRSTFHVPYGNVLNNAEAFSGQGQTVLLAEIDSQVIGFMSLLPCGDELLQTHGGFDYDFSLKAKAYHNLIYASIDHAIQNGFSRLSLGPLNNETKRRAGSEMMPVVAGLWNRKVIDRIISRNFFIRRFQIFRGWYDR